MANKKFSELTTLPSFSDASLICVAKDSTSYKATILSLADYFGIDVFELPKKYDSILYEYKLATTVTVKAGGSCKSDDGTKNYYIASNEDISFISNLAYGESEAASTLYYLWIGTNAAEEDEIVISENDTTPPNESGESTTLTKSHRLRGCIYNNDISNILPFLMTQEFYYYNISMDLAGSDPTEVLDVTLTAATWTDVDCSSFVPKGTVFAILSAYLTLTANDLELLGRQDGTSHNGFIVIGSKGSNLARYIWNSSQLYPLDAGIAEIKSTVAAATKISVFGFLLI